MWNLISNPFMKLYFGLFIELEFEPFVKNTFETFEELDFERLGP